MSVALIAGTGDLVADAKYHSARLHEEISHSELVMEESVGHMAHYGIARAHHGGSDQAGGEPGVGTLRGQTRSDRWPDFSSPTFHRQRAANPALQR